MKTLVIATLQFGTKSVVLYFKQIKIGGVLALSRIFYTLTPAVMFFVHTFASLTVAFDCTYFLESGSLWSDSIV